MSQEASVQTVLACSQCGRALAHSELVQIAGNWVCADCKPAFLSRVMASGAAGASPLAWRYGGFWIRFGARMSDGLIFTVLKYRSATLGKMACGLTVSRSDGRSLGWGVCFGRFFMWNVVTSGIPYLNFVLMLVSSIMLGVDAEKRALHDRVCDTRVVYKRSLA